MNTTIIGYPRIGTQRELKKVTELYFKGELTQENLILEATKLKIGQWLTQKQKNLTVSPVNDFSFYDNMLDMASLLNVIPARYQALGLNTLDTYFAMARGYQEKELDVKALKLRKWFNTNYHYLVPEIEDNTIFKINDEKIFNECSEAEKIRLVYRPAIIGPYTFLKLSNNRSTKDLSVLAVELAEAYSQLFSRLTEYKFEYLQLDEPALVLDMSDKDIALFMQFYTQLLGAKHGKKILLQTYFGDIRDIYESVLKLDFDAIGLDFAEGGQSNLELIKKFGFSANKVLYAGLINGKNIWRNNYKKSLETLCELKNTLPEESIVLNTSCSLLHVPYSVKYEKNMNEKYRKHLAFAEEKLEELQVLKALTYSRPEFTANQLLVLEKKNNPDFLDNETRAKTAEIFDLEFMRAPRFAERIKLQQEILHLPLLPTTTIGSFPQTAEVRELRKDYKQGRLTSEEYETKLKEKIQEVIVLQDELGLDVLVHGEYERNDMVEYFGENLQGFLFTENGWVQSYGTRAVKPPIIFGDVSRIKPFTLKWITYAQSLTKKTVKGMLTGPITILNWSFPREDISLKEIAYQIALAIQAEVLDLEKNGIRIIQIDEAALREKLPLRKAYWHKEYLDWAIKAFRLVHYLVKPATQIHTHMCYSEFEDIIEEIKAMDADVITIEAARSDLTLLDTLKKVNYDKQIGPGIYDIHSPRVPKIEELAEIIEKMCGKLDQKNLWVNPDCGLKTRDENETIANLRNMVKAAALVRGKVLSK